MLHPLPEVLQNELSSLRLSDGVLSVGKYAGWIMKQDVIPSAKIISQTVQVGQPGHPIGLLVSGTFKVDGTHWELKNPWWRKRYWISEPKEFEKKCNIKLTAKEMEKLIGDWTKEWLDFEEWGEVVRARTAARKAFDDQFIEYEKIFRDLFGAEIAEFHKKDISIMRKRELAPLLRYN